MGSIIYAHLLPSWLLLISTPASHSLSLSSSIHPSHGTVDPSEQKGAAITITDQKAYAALCPPVTANAAFGVYCISTFRATSLSSRLVFHRFLLFSQMCRPASCLANGHSPRPCFTFRSAFRLSLRCSILRTLLADDRSGAYLVLFLDIQST